jgi:hypothetical protein
MLVASMSSTLRQNTFSDVAGPREQLVEVVAAAGAMYQPLRTNPREESVGPAEPSGDVRNEVVGLELLRSHPSAPRDHHVERGRSARFGVRDRDGREERARV